MVHWQLRSWVFTHKNWPTWVEDRTWAPELHFVNGRYLLFFTGGGNDGKLASGVAITQTSDPFGSYKDIGTPLIESPQSLGGAIDPHHFKDPITGRHYLLWKADKPLSLQPSLIYIRELYPSGTAFRVNTFIVEIRYEMH